MHIPDDIARLILEQAALDDHKMAPTLVLVARRVQCWIDPILYSRVLLRGTNHILAFCNMLDVCKTKHPSFFAAHVKTLGVPFTAPVLALLKIISICTGITELNCFYTPACPLPCGCLSSPAQVSGCVVMDSLDRIAAQLPLLTRISLNLRDNVPGPTYDATGPLTIPAALITLLARCDTITACLLLVGRLSNWYDLPEVDPRITVQMWRSDPVCLTLDERRRLWSEIERIVRRKLSRAKV